MARAQMPLITSNVRIVVLRKSVCPLARDFKEAQALEQTLYITRFRSEIFHRFLHDRLNLTNVVEPFFVIDSMDSYTSYNTVGDGSMKVVVFAVNQKGRSQGTLIKEFSFDDGNEIAGELLL